MHIWGLAVPNISYYFLRRVLMDTIV